MSSECRKFKRPVYGESSFCEACGAKVELFPGKEDVEVVRVEEILGRDERLQSHLDHDTRTRFFFPNGAMKLALGSIDPHQDHYDKTIDAGTIANEMRDFAAIYGEEIVKLMSAYERATVEWAAFTVVR